MKKLILSLLTVLLVLSGCSPKLTIEKVEEQAQPLLDEGKYTEVFDLYQKALEAGLDKETILTKIKEAYDGYASSIVDNGGSAMDVLAAYQEMGTKFPDLAEYSEQAVAATAAYFLVYLSNNDAVALTTSYQFITDTYSESELIRKTLEETYKTTLNKYVVQDLNDLVNAGFINYLINGEFDEIFGMLDNSKLSNDVYYCTELADMPISIQYGNYMLAAEPSDGFTVLYYGEHDAENKRSGNGYHLVYGKTTEGMYYEEIAFGSHTDNMMNGDFMEVVEYKIENVTKYTVKGTMKENKYDGNITLALSTDIGTATFVMKFEDGTLVPMESYENEGEMRYFASLTTVNGEIKTLMYNQNMMDALHGLCPYYELPF